MKKAKKSASKKRPAAKRGGTKKPPAAKRKKPAAKKKNPAEKKKSVPGGEKLDRVARKGRRHAQSTILSRN